MGSPFRESMNWGSVFCPSPLGCHQAAILDLVTVKNWGEEMFLEGVPGVELKKMSQGG